MVISMTASKANDNTRELTPVTNLYLVVLKFRFPPLNLIQEAPNALTFLPPHSDSILLFADIIRRYTSHDWRYDFAEAALFRKLDKEYPDSLNLLHELNAPLATVFLPVIRENEKYLEILISTKYPYLLKVLVEDSKATLLEISKYDSISRQENLWLRKRDDIAKLGVLNDKYLKLIRMIDSINSSRGGYKAIEVSLKIPIEHLSTKMVFLASIKNRDILEEELKVLERTGVGKKRDMGFGDLVGWKIYPVDFNDNLRIIGPMALAHEEANKTRIITLRNTPSSFITSLKEKGGLLPLNMKMVLSRTKPPYWVREELCITPFSEFLFKKP